MWDVICGCMMISVGVEIYLWMWDYICEYGMISVDVRFIFGFGMLSVDAG